MLKKELDTPIKIMQLFRGAKNYIIFQQCQNLTRQGQAHSTNYIEILTKWRCSQEKEPYMDFRELA